MRIMELQHKNGYRLYVNLDHIALMERNDMGRSRLLINGEYIIVEESVDTILKEMNRVHSGD